MSTEPWNFVVARDDPRRSRFISLAEDDRPLSTGEVEFEVERFAISANNLTYAASGDALGYWRLFQAAGGWGIVPAWGYAVARRSQSEVIGPGGRVFGLVPMGSRFRMRPRRVRLGLFDQSPHRQDVNPAYNLYADAPIADLVRDELTATLRPLAILGFALADHINTADGLATASVVITGASSRSAVSLGWMLGAVADRRRIGVSSPRNRPFAEDSGAFDNTAVYGDDLPLGSADWIHVDFTGDADLIARTAQAVGRAPAQTVCVGSTHISAAGGQLNGPGEVFFAPDHIQSRIAAWGQQEFHRRFGQAFGAFVEEMGRRLVIVRGHGPAALAAAWNRLILGRSDPREAVMVVPALPGDKRS